MYLKENVFFVQKSNSDTIFDADVFLAPCLFFFIVVRQKSPKWALFKNSFINTADDSYTHGSKGASFNWSVNRCTANQSLKLFVSIPGLGFLINPICYRSYFEFIFGGCIELLPLKTT